MKKLTKNLFIFEYCYKNIIFLKKKKCKKKRSSKSTAIIVKSNKGCGWCQCSGLFC